jgi:hypothetical protein
VLRKDAHQRPRGESRRSLAGDQAWNSICVVCRRAVSEWTRAATLSGTVAYDLDVSADSTMLSVLRRIGGRQDVRVFSLRLITGETRGGGFSFGQRLADSASDGGRAMRQRLPHRSLRLPLRGADRETRGRLNTDTGFSARYLVATT